MPIWQRQLAASVLLSTLWSMMDGNRPFQFVRESVRVRAFFGGIVRLSMLARVLVFRSACFVCRIVQGFCWASFVSACLLACFFRSACFVCCIVSEPFLGIVRLSVLARVLFRSACCVCRIVPHVCTYRMSYGCCSSSAASCIRLACRMCILIRVFRTHRIGLSVASRATK